MPTVSGSRQASTAASKRRLSAASLRASAQTRIAQRSRICRHSSSVFRTSLWVSISIPWWDLQSRIRLEYARSSIRMASFSAVASSRGGCSWGASTAGSWSASRGCRSSACGRWVWISATSTATRTVTFTRGTSGSCSRCCVSSASRACAQALGLLSLSRPIRLARQAATESGTGSACSLASEQRSKWCRPGARVP